MNNIIQDKQLNNYEWQTVKCWIFDLDNTLYSPRHNLFPQISQKMGEFIMKHLELGHHEAKALQKNYYHKFGTTLNGLMKNHQIKPQHFLEYVHDIDYSILPFDQELKSALTKLKGRKIIHTNGTKAHSRSVMRQLGIDQEIEEIFDIEDSNYIPKPAPEPYHALIEKYQIIAKETVMVEDLPQNLAVPASLGMKTILVYSNDHDPLRSDVQDVDFHHKIEDLTKLLVSITQAATYPNNKS